MKNSVKLLLERLVTADGFSSRTLSKMRLVEWHDDRVVCEMPVEKEHLNLFGTLHGGVTATLVDVGGSLAIAAKTKSPNTGVSADLSVSYLSSGKLGDNIRFLFVKLTIGGVLNTVYCIGWRQSV